MKIHIIFIMVGSVSIRSARSDTIRTEIPGIRQESAMNTAGELRKGIIGTKLRVAHSNDCFHENHFYCRYW